MVAQVKSTGGLCWKFTSPGTRGVPDRWCVLRGLQFFVELKRPGHKHRADEKLQLHRREQMRKQGVPVYLIESKQEVDLLMKWAAIGHLPKAEYFAGI